eukprot:3215445-Lingulodinium_polyedra.AAC.1
MEAILVELPRTSAKRRPRRRNRRSSPRGERFLGFLVAAVVGRAPLGRAGTSRLGPPGLGREQVRPETVNVPVSQFGA